jgi:Putative DNA-binding domain
MLKISTKEDLQRLVDEGIQESLTLDYKASLSLARDDKPRDELCKDVSAFANSAGGQIIYGVVEKDRKPVKVDDGSDLSREWIEQVIDSRVQPRLDGLVITPVAVSSGRHAYVLTIPQASGRAPHQAPDKKYYKRQNFQSVPMEDYEIRDALRRATTPELYVELSFATGETAQVEFVQSERAKPITLSGIVRNRSSQPAYYALVQVGIDAELPIHTFGDFVSMRITGDDQQRQHWLGHRFISPPGMPIFKEIDDAALHRLSLTFTYPSSRQPGETIFYLTTSVQTAGYAATENWIIHHRDNILWLRRRAAAG